MSIATINRTPAALTVTLPADCSQAAWESALDWAIPELPGCRADLCRPRRPARLAILRCGLTDLVGVEIGDSYLDPRQAS